MEKTNKLKGWFGRLLCKHDYLYLKNEDCYMVHIEVNNDCDFKFCFKEYVFVDGTPFGVKE